MIGTGFGVDDHPADVVGPRERRFSEAEVGTRLLCQPDVRTDGELRSCETRHTLIECELSRGRLKGRKALVHLTIGQYLVVQTPLLRCPQ